MTVAIVINSNCLVAGISNFIEYQNYLACGESYSRFEAGRFRATGPTMVPGAIYACIERGLSTGEEIVAATAKSTRCKHWTVSNILDELTGPCEQGYPFRFDGGAYHLNKFIKCKETALYRPSSPA